MFGKFVLVSCLTLFASSVFAARQAVVIIDGAMVYKKGDFGAPVLGYLRKGKKVKVSNKTYGAFYRVKLRQGIIGYISDIDVEVKQRSASRRKARRGKSRTKKGFRGRPIIAGKKLGLGLSSVAFVDRFKKSGESTETSISSQSLLLSAKYTKPFDLLDGAMLQDITLGMSVSTPSLYDQFSLAKPDGFILIGDYSLLVPVRSMTNASSSLYWGGGLSVAYSLVNLTTIVNSVQTKVAAEELRIGGALTAGWAKKLSKNYLFKVEPKFYLEKESYLGFHVFIQKSLN